jgi:muconolactone delta-isomerase
VEVKLKATQKTVEKLFYVKPGADPSKIVVEVDGAEGLKLSKDGEIIIQTGLGELKLSKPIAWQEKDGKKLPVEVSYKLIGKNRYSFDVAKADPSLPIVIDPILQSTYLGGGGDDVAFALVIHPKTGDVYVAGWTTSIDFPNTAGGARASKSGDYDAFVARLNSSLTQILQSTYLGGSRNDSAHTLAIHPKTGDVYVAGWTESLDFPETFGGAQPTYGRGYPDAFVTRLNKELTQILQSTYLGGSGEDLANALAIHPKTGDVYVAGGTDSNDFPKTTGGAQVAYGGGDGDAFVVRLNKELTQILQSTYLGGSDSDGASALAIHPEMGEVYVAGRTRSTNFPKTTGGAQGRHGGSRRDAFVARLNKDLTQILQSTYLGGNSKDLANAIAIHPKTGEVYVAGDTLSTDFPKTSGGAQTKCNECSMESKSSDVFVARLNKELTQILQSTYLGGSRGEEAYALAIHPKTGEVYVAGDTVSTDFPKTTGGAQPYCNTCESGGFLINDAFVARLNKDLTQILQSTYLGGSSVDTASALAIHPKTGEVYVAGHTWSKNFPKTTGGAQANYGGGSYEAFVARLTANLAATGGSKGGGSGGGSGGCSGGGGGCSKNGSASSPAGLWNILVWLSFPAFVVARRIRRK